jgi:hypothetical protein
MLVLKGLSLDRFNCKCMESDEIHKNVVYISKNSIHIAHFGVTFYFDCTANTFLKIFFQRLTCSGFLVK